MLKYELISRDWIVSPAARIVYRVSAGLSLALFLVLLGLLVEEFRVPASLTLVVRLLLFLGVAGAATTIAGMEFFLFRFDDSSALKQVLWFVMMLIPLLGAPLYCFFVYSRSDVVKSSYADRAQGASA
jgi:hypothetical protein